MLQIFQVVVKLHIRNVKIDYLELKCTGINKVISMSKETDLLYVKIQLTHLIKAQVLDGLLETGYDKDSVEETAERICKHFEKLN